MSLQKTFSHLLAMLCMYITEPLILAVSRSLQVLAEIQ